MFKNRLYLLLTLFTLASVNAFATQTYTESSTASDLTTVQTCNSVSTQNAAGVAPVSLVLSGAATGTVSPGIAKSSTQNLEMYSASGYPGFVSWQSGNWVIQLDVTTANSNISWVDTCIIRVNSSGTAQATVGSLTGQNISMGTTGVKSMTISGAAQTASTSDRFVVVINLHNSHTTGGNQAVGLDMGGTSDTVATPLIPPAPTCGGSNAISLLGVGCR